MGSGNRVSEGWLNVVIVTVVTVVTVVTDGTDITVKCAWDHLMVTGAARVAGMVLKCALG